MFWPWAIAALVIIGLVAWLVQYREKYQAAKRTERRQAEKVLAYKAMRGWGDYADPEREAFIDGWLDQVFAPAIAAFPTGTSEARIAAYMSGYVWSRDRDQLAMNPVEEPEF